MRINKWILRENCFRKKNREVCGKIKVDEPEQAYLKANVLHIIKIIKEREVDQMLDKLAMNNRLGSKIYIKEPHKPSSKSSIIRHIELYNALPFELKSMKISSIKRKFKKHDVVFND